MRANLAVIDKNILSHLLNQANYLQFEQIQSGMLYRQLIRIIKRYHN